MMEAAVAYSPSTGIRLECETDLPGIQVYTGNFLDEPGGKYGLKWGKHQGFCLETQTMPDSVHHQGEADFTNCILHPGETYDYTTVYRFSAE